MSELIPRRVPTRGITLITPTSMLRFKACYCFEGAATLTQLRRYCYRNCSHAITILAHNIVRLSCSECFSRTVGKYKLHRLPRSRAKSRETQADSTAKAPTLRPTCEVLCCDRSSNCEPDRAHMHKRTAKAPTLRPTGELLRCDQSSNCEPDRAHMHRVAKQPN